MDSDIQTDNGSIEVLVSTLARSNTDGVCGRMRPATPGCNPIQLMQGFEYQIQQQLLKRLESGFASSVTCLPGAFTLLRYNSFRQCFKSIDKVPSGIVEHLLDLGEDRWLTTEMLMRGMRTDYAPTATMCTEVPSNAVALFKQRRRWFNSSFVCDFVMLSRFVFGCRGGSLRAVLVPIFICVLALLRLIGAFLSIALSVLVMANVVYIFGVPYEYSVCATGGYAVLLLTSFLVFAAIDQYGTTPGTLLAKLRDSKLLQNFQKRWMTINLLLSSAFITAGMVAAVHHAIVEQQIERYFWALLFIGLTFLLSLSIGQTSSQFGHIQMLAGGLLYFTLGLGFFLFMVPLFSFANLDSRAWGVRGVDEVSHECSSGHVHVVEPRTMGGLSDSERSFSYDTSTNVWARAHTPEGSLSLKPHHKKLLFVFLLVLANAGFVAVAVLVQAPTMLSCMRVAVGLAAAMVLFVLARNSPLCVKRPFPHGATGTSGMFHIDDLNAVHIELDEAKGGDLQGSNDVNGVSQSSCDTLLNSIVARDGEEVSSTGDRWPIIRARRPSYSRLAATAASALAHSKTSPTILLPIETRPGALTRAAPLETSAPRSRRPSHDLAGRARIEPAVCASRSTSVPSQRCKALPK